MDSLTVYLNDVPVGRLTDDNGQMSFAYEAAYAADSGNEPLSHTLPLRSEPYDHPVMEPFLSGLLPEDIIRTRIGRILQIPRENRRTDPAVASGGFLPVIESRSEAQV